MKRPYEENRLLFSRLWEVPSPQLPCPGNTEPMVDMAETQQGNSPYFPTNRIRTLVYCWLDKENLVLGTHMQIYS